MKTITLIILIATLVQGCAKENLNLTETKENSQESFEMASLLENGQIQRHSRVWSVDFRVYSQITDSQIPDQPHAADQIVETSLSLQPDVARPLPYHLNLTSGVLKHRAGSQIRRLSRNELLRVQSVLKQSAYMSSNYSDCMPFHTSSEYAVLRGSVDLHLNQMAFGCGGADLVYRNSKKRVGFDQILSALVNFDDDGIEIPIIDEPVPNANLPVIKLQRGNSFEIHQVSQVCAYDQAVAPNQDSQTSLPTTVGVPHMKRCVNFELTFSPTEPGPINFGRPVTQSNEKVFNLLNGQAIFAKEIICQRASTNSMNILTIETTKGELVSISPGCESKYTLKTAIEIFNAIF